MRHSDPQILLKSRFWFLQNLVGGYILKSIAALAALCAIIKPLLKTQNKITAKESALSSYQLLEFELSLIGIEVQNQKQFDQALQKRLMKIMEKKAALVTKDIEGTDEELRRQCFEQVNRELPTNSFYIPLPTPVASEESEKTSKQPQASAERIVEDKNGEV